MFAALLEYIFPSSETSRLVARTSENTILDAYTPYAWNNDQNVALASYANPHVRAAIHECKFRNNHRAAMLLGVLLSEYLDSRVRKPMIIVPVPLSRKRYRARGYNQVTRIVRAARPHSTRADDVLIRVRHTQPQTEMSREERKRNVSDAFSIRDRRAAERIRGTHILLVDDVTTTGATLTAARATLQSHNPASVTCLAIARS